MKFSRIAVPLLCIALLYWGFRQFGWAGVAAVGGGLMMWLLLHFTRMMSVMKRATNRPIGYVDSAVMLNAKLRAGVPLIQVIALTRSLGLLRSPQGDPIEVYRWTDSGNSWVETEFSGGKLLRWTMHRPPVESTESADDGQVAP
jgi:hypothetical protein